ncbi:MAG: HlyD family efflux transporter periplasmic adaptor subunit, partial [Eubacteriales bacterium]
MYKRNEAEIKVRVRRNPRRALRKFILLVITFYVIFLVYGFVRDLVVTRLARVEQIQQGVLQATLPATGVLVRNEKVVSAPHTGTLKVLASEGERVRVGQVVAQVVVATMDSKTGETVFNITTPRSGIVSYTLDGLEEVYSPRNVRELDLNKIETIKNEPHRFLPGSRVEEGKPVLKIVNNLEPVSIIAVTQNSFKLPEKGQKKPLLLILGADENDLTQAVIQEAPFRGKANEILLNLVNFKNSLIATRKLDFKIISARYEGYILPLSAIAIKQGKDGIYIVYKERVKWKNVQVLGRTAEKVAISGITPDIKVILNP